MLISSGSRVARFAAVALAGAFLASCGGGSTDEQADVLVCIFTNCTESSTLRVDEISPHFRVTQADADTAVVAQAQLGHSANVLTVVRPSPGDVLSAGLAGQPPRTMDNTDGARGAYAARLPTAAPQPEVVVSLRRGGVDYAGRVTLPARFGIDQPAGPLSLKRTDSPIAVQLSLAPQVSAELRVDSGQCDRLDGSRFDLTDLPLPARKASAGSSVYVLDGPALEASLNQWSQQLASNGSPTTPGVARCQLNLAWTVEVAGSLDPAFNRHGNMFARRQAHQTLAFDAQR